MSNFDGKISEYPWIAVDCFLKANYEADCYLLSHLHQDHMKGLDSPAFKTHLNGRPKSRIYCSEITKSILLHDPNYYHLKWFVYGIPINHKTFIEYTDHCDTSCPQIQKVAMTFLPSGHCPGSVMFLLEGYNGTILYTGDFRFETDENKFVVYNRLNLIDIDCLYLDTTFFLPEMMIIPNRKTSAKSIVSKIQEWLCQSNYHVVCLRCRAKLGYEYLLIEVAKSFNTKILVNHEQMKFYSCIPEVQSKVTTNEKGARIHMCIRGRCRLLSQPPTQESIKWKILRIKPCALSFAYDSTALQRGYIKKGYNFYSFLYSSHASMGETIDFIKYLRPTKINPNVIPVKADDLKVVQQRIRNIMENDDSSCKKAKMIKSSCTNNIQTLPLEPIRNIAENNCKSSSKKAVIIELNDQSFMLDDIMPCNKFICRRRSKGHESSTS